VRCERVGEREQDRDKALEGGEGGGREHERIMNIYCGAGQVGCGAFR
jgi:hypothetical protein